MGVGGGAMADLREEVPFKDAQEEYLYHLIRAEYHIQRAMAQVDKPKGPKRSLILKSLLRRAHGIVIGLYRQEEQHRRTSESL